MIEQSFILNERIFGSALSQSEGREPSLTERESAVPGRHDMRQMRSNAERLESGWNS